MNLHVHCPDCDACLMLSDDAPSRRAPLRSVPPPTPAPVRQGDNGDALFWALSLALLIGGCAYLAMMTWED